MARKAATKEDVQKVATSIAEVIDKYSNKSTQAGYRNAIQSFLRCMNHLPKVKLLGNKKVRLEYDYEGLLQKYLNDKKRDVTADFEKYAACLLTETTSKASAKQMMTFSRTFLARFGIIADMRTIQDIKREMKGKNGTQKKDVSAEVIEKAIAEMDVKGRALILTLSSSGIRLNEALSIECYEEEEKGKIKIKGDIDFDHSPVVIQNIQGKNGSTRYSYLTEEAARCIKAWLPQREAYLRTSTSRAKGLVQEGQNIVPKTKDDKRLFPFSDSVANQIWETALKASNQLSFDGNTGRNQRRLHQLRAFFVSTFKLGGYAEIGESLAGHEGYCNGAYDQFPIGETKSIYEKVATQLTIGVTSEVRKDSGTIHKTLRTQDESIEYLRSKNDQLTGQVMRLTEKIDAMTKAATIEAAFSPEEIEKLKKLLKK